jgi:hypothetical protein
VEYFLNNNDRIAIPLKIATKVELYCRVSNQQFCINSGGCPQTPICLATNQKLGCDPKQTGSHLAEIQLAAHDRKNSVL